MIISVLMKLKPIIDQGSLVNQDPLEVSGQDEGLLLLARLIARGILKRQVSQNLSPSSSAVDLPQEDKL
jgi:hypothetical protein